MINGFGCIGSSGKIVYTHVQLEHEHWTRLLPGFRSAQEAHTYLETVYPELEIVSCEDFGKRMNVVKEKINKERLPEGDVATINEDCQLLLLRGTKTRTISGLTTYEEAKEMWQGLYNNYQLVSPELFERIKTKREVSS